MFTSIHIRGEIMQFIYRGVKYNSQPNAAKVREGEVGGKYRGQVWHRHLNTEKAAQKPLHNLKYRGVALTL
ncbi:DUF4278 domain-containing protein [filamentous cyanobacterium LEGE 11480]|uniref:DUF4278 domain-containing protein n=1 Tax=Romeriopsis navalis LEGE 11480 TaxID=2777977 RepID=A0A928VUJ4_9CYAN|nr:DUF4278 domain-containing protein [Romeriopsis navalis]MBE9032334.1 DUF4278 domain-containing protein [Romeriopsis navalis LEGE 11480]